MANKLITFLFVLVLLCNSRSVHAQGANEFPEYVIQEGDSLGYIAGLFDTTVGEIINVNSLSNPDLISPGQRIKIPGLQGIVGTLEITTTQLGERFPYLPVKYGVEVEKIIRINKILSPSRIYPGSTLIIPISNAKASLLPVVSMDRNESGLECAVNSRKNPQVLNLQNRVNDLNLVVNGEVLFSEPSPDTQSIDLFAPPMTEVKLYPLPLTQGATEVVSVTTESPVSLAGTLGEYDLTFFSESPGQYYSLQGIHALAEPGLVDFQFTAIFEDGSIHKFNQMVLLTPGVFDEDPPLIVDPKTIDPTITAPENELVASLVSQKTPVRYWSEVFTSPAVYQEYNSLYGTRRRYNEDPEVRFHSGVDFAGGLTLPITAPAPGLVVFAGPLTVRGNAVFIDHGWGVFSGFFHQATLNVKVGDQVDTGQMIGTVGNTGRVNGAGDYYGAGAHLHWEVWVNNVQVNPLDWLTDNFP